MQEINVTYENVLIYSTNEGCISACQIDTSCHAAMFDTPSQTCYSANQSKTPDEIVLASNGYMADPWKVTLIGEETAAREKITEICLIF